MPSMQSPCAALYVHPSPIAQVLTLWSPPVQAALVAQLDWSVESVPVQVAAVPHGTEAHSSMLSWQLSPLVEAQPAAQAQAYASAATPELPESVHAPPFLHGVDTHSSMSSTQVLPE